MIYNFLLLIFDFFDLHQEPSAMSVQCLVVVPVRVNESDRTIDASHDGAQGFVFHAGLRDPKQFFNTFHIATGETRSTVVILSSVDEGGASNGSYVAHRLHSWTHLLTRLTTIYDRIEIGQCNSVDDV
jgi:hypothetical protein